MSAITNFFLGIPFLNNLGPFTITKLAEEANTLKFPKGAMILEEGTQCSSLYIVASGKLEFYKRFDDDTDVIFQTLNPKDIFGEDYLLSGLPCDGYLIAASNVVVVILNKATIDSILRDNNTFFQNYINLFNKKIIAKSESIDTLLSMLLAVDLHIPKPFILRDNTQKITANNIPLVLDYNNNNPFEASNTEDIFYHKEITCPLCTEKYQTLKPRH